jgi:hypothetical protein
MAEYGVMNYTEVVKKIATGIDGNNFFIQGFNVMGDIINEWRFNRATGTFMINGLIAASPYTEITIDFGDTKPVQSKTFTIVNPNVTATSKIMAVPSGTIAEGRVGNDWEWDSIQFAAKSFDGSFELTAFASGSVKGKRNIFYTIQ